MARDYFDQYPDTNIEIIMLYQAAIAVDMTKDTTQLTHCFMPVSTVPGIRRGGTEARRRVASPWNRWSATSSKSPRA